jgi:hypothetical protein
VTSRPPSRSQASMPFSDGPIPALYAAGLGDCYAWVPRPCGYPPPPLPPSVFGANSLFSMGWTEGSSVSTFVFRSLEDKLLKTGNLCSLVCAIEPETKPQVHSENAPLNEMLADSGKQSANGLAAEDADDKGDTLSTGKWLLDKFGVSVAGCRSSGLRGTASGIFPHGIMLYSSVWPRLCTSR